MIFACSHSGLGPLTEAVTFTINALIDSLVRITISSTTISLPLWLPEIRS